MQRTAPEVVSASILGALTGWTLCCGEGRQETPLQQPGSIISGLEECSTGGGSGTASVAHEQAPTHPFILHLAQVSFSLSKKLPKINV